MKKYIRLLLRPWKIPDRVPNHPVTAVVGMSLSPDREGNCSAILQAVVRACAEQFHSGTAPKIVFSNRFVQNGRVLAIAERDLALTYGVPNDALIIPRHAGNPRIRNTWEEAKFALRLLRCSPQQGPKSILVIANAVHMRRVRAALCVLQPRGVEIYWKSVHDDAYGADAVQQRFHHPLFFLAYEALALAYSKAKGWA